MQLGRERAFSGALRLLQCPGDDTERLIRVADDDQGFGQVRPMGEPHSLADRAKEIGAFTHHGDTVRLT